MSLFRVPGSPLVASAWTASHPATLRAKDRRFFAAGVPALALGLVPALVLALVLAARAHAATAEELKVALVIGNASYRSAPLANPVNDAEAIAARLRSLGFTVIERENLTRDQLGKTLHEFRTRLRPGAVALFYYAGHGLQVHGENYLPVVDADIQSEEDVRPQSLDLRDVLGVMDQSQTRLNLLFLDACRNNPFSRSFRSMGEGLAKVEAPSGTIISFATRPGSVAADSGSGRNGLYTEHLLKAMDLGHVPIEQALKQVVSGVKRASDSRQEPWMEGSIDGDFCFGGCDGGAAVPRLASLQSPASVRSSEQIEDELWDSIKDSREANDFDAYLQSYPNGRYALIARVKVRSLRAAGSVAAGVPTPAQRPGPAGVVQRPTDGVSTALPAVSAGSTEHDPSSLAVLLASQLSEGLARSATGAGAGGTRVTVSFLEDINKRGDRIFGAWRLDVAGAPGCSTQIPERWFGRGGFAGIGQAKDEAISTAYGTLLRYLKERVYSGPQPSC